MGDKFYKYKINLPHVIKVLTNVENMADSCSFSRFPKNGNPNSFLSIVLKFGANTPDSKITTSIKCNKRFYQFHELTVRCKILKGSENGELESVVYKTVSFSAPNIIASSKSIAEKG